MALCHERKHDNIQIPLFSVRHLRGEGNFSDSDKEDGRYGLNSLCIEREKSLKDLGEFGSLLPFVYLFVPRINGVKVTLAFLDFPLTFSFMFSIIFSYIFRISRSGFFSYFIGNVII